jgi:hypothetical protein
MLMMLTFWGAKENILERKTEALLAASKETGPLVNAQKSKCILCFTKRMQDTITT